MTARRSAIQALFAGAGTLLATVVSAHPGHGAPEGHIHGLLEALVLAGALAVSIWIARGKGARRKTRIPARLLSRRRDRR